MRELAVTLEFTKHCIGNVKRYCWENGKKRSFFVMPRSPTGKVIFLPTWWAAVLTKAAAVGCRHQETVKLVRFSLEVEGQPRKVPDFFYKRYSEGNCFSRHEAFFPGDRIELTCLVPDQISNEDFSRLLTLAGRYYGISPARPNEFGFFIIAALASTASSSPTPMASHDNSHGSFSEKRDVDVPGESTHCGS